jgi:hypothetical protein
VCARGALWPRVCIHAAGERRKARVQRKKRKRLLPTQIRVPTRQLRSAHTKMPVTCRPARPAYATDPADPSSVPDEPVASAKQPTPPPAPLPRRYKGESFGSPLRPRSLLPAFDRVSLGDSDEGEEGQHNRPIPMRRPRTAGRRAAAGGAAQGSAARAERNLKRARREDPPESASPSTSSPPPPLPVDIYSAHPEGPALPEATINARSHAVTAAVVRVFPRGKMRRGIV